MLYGTSKVGEFAGHPDLTYFDKEHLPHWIAYGQGWCQVHFVLYPQGLSIDTTEARENKGRTTTKRTMETLDEATTRKLYAMLKARFEPDEKPAP